MQRINVNIGRIVMQGIELPADRAQLLKEQVRAALEQGLSRAERPPVHGRDACRLVSQSAAVPLRDGGERQSELAGQLARAILNSLNVSEGHLNNE